MSRKLLNTCLFLVLLLCVTASATEKYSDAPDSVYLLSHGTNGLRFAWSTDKQNWHEVGNGEVFLKSDFGAWGSEKKMYDPYLIRGKGSQWEVLWSLNEHSLQFAQASSKDLIYWGPQSYPYVKKGKNVLKPVISFDRKTGIYTIVYKDAAHQYFRTTTRDFKVYTATQEVNAAQYRTNTLQVKLAEDTVMGQVHRVSWDVVEALNKSHQLRQLKALRNAENTSQDPQRFKELKPQSAKLIVQPQQAKTISNMLIGGFFEDINYAADGGLYAELIQNRDFEYQPRDKRFQDKNWNAKHSWSLKGKGANLTIDSVSPLHINNPHYAVLSAQQAGAALLNSGYDAIPLKAGDTYDFSIFLNFFGKAGVPMEVRLVSKKLGVLAKTTITPMGSGWQKYAVVLQPKVDAADAHLELQLLAGATAGIDMVSLFPKKTFKGRKNGLRADLAQVIAAIYPKFVRFPGGCVAHGDGLDNIYNWKNSIGKLESRVPDRNLWGYHQSLGLGYFEYFQFCEDIGAAPIPVLAAGVPCQNSSTGGGGQQGGIPMEEMGAYIQDIIDLVEYANGGIDTKWGKKRAEAGHPAPFNLKYIGIGNEDLITELFRERFTMIYHALKKSHPEITVIGTVGPFFEGTDYVEGWKIATDLKVPMVDEHYYQSPGWFINNQNYYDSYDRNKSKVYLGEYAASVPGGNKTNLETALAEAIYLTGVERNADVVHMTSYAPLLAREGHTQWNPDLVYFNHLEVKPTVSYYVQQLYGQNAGDKYLPSILKLTSTAEEVIKRVSSSVVVDSETGDLIVKLVNILPVAVDLEIDLAGAHTGTGKVMKIILAGKPSEREARPVVSELKDTNGRIALQPYSFTVLRYKKH